MRIHLTLLTAVATLALTLSAHATTYTTSGALQTGTFTGTFSIDNSGNITGGSFLANGVSYTTFGSGSFAPGENNGYSFAYFHNSTLTQSFDLELALTNGVYSGTPVFCTTTALCSGTDSNIITFKQIGSAASFNEVVSANVIKAAAPEPSSLVLLGTGILSFAGAVRRRFLQI